MPLETATYISDLNTSNPASSDGLNQADDHLRLIKATVKATFPNFTAAALSATQADIDAAVAAVVTRPNATVPTGSIMDFGMATAPTGWLECTGAAVSRTTYAALYAAIGTTWGAGDGSTTFNLPPDRYRRGRNAAAAAVGTLQADQNKSHTHLVSGNTGNESVGHSHSYSGTTGNDSPDHSHDTSVFSNNGVGGGSTFVVYTAAALTSAGGSGSWPLSSGGASARHAHSFSGTTGTDSVHHTHAVSITSATGSADGSEARPLSATFLTCIKT